MSSTDLSSLLDILVLPAEAAVGYISERPTALVFNTNPSWVKHNGHWVAAYFDEKFNGIFFDSYGRHPAELGFEKFMTDNCNQWYYNDKVLQSNYSSACGHHVAAFCVSLLGGMTFLEYISLFSDNVHFNDYLVATWIKKWTAWK